MTSADREGTECRRDGGVVVGDDGSAYAATAVRGRAEEPARRGGTLRVIRAWAITSAVTPADVPLGMVTSRTELETATLEAERQRITELLHDSGATVEVHAVRASPAKALLTAAETADLLVVGTRGLGGFTSLLLGSVAEQCIRHAQCSVLV